MEGRAEVGLKDSGKDGRGMSSRGLAAVQAKTVAWIEAGTDRTINPTYMCPYPLLVGAVMVCRAKVVRGRVGPRWRLLLLAACSLQTRAIRAAGEARGRGEA